MVVTQDRPADARPGRRRVVAVRARTALDALEHLVGDWAPPCWPCSPRCGWP